MSESEFEEDASQQSDESILNESQAYSSDQEAMPETLKQIFEAKEDPKKLNASIFTKNRARNIDSSNIEEEKMRNANALFDSACIFNSMPLNAKEIKPMNSAELDRKERLKQREQTTGKDWGSMPKVELTDALKNDLKAIKFRNQIFPKRFYKNNDSESLPTYFQVGTVVESGGIGRVGDRLTKKMQKRSVAEQFLMDDEANAFSKRKYEGINDVRRRMGKKKANLKKNKAILAKAKRGKKITKKTK
jgi:hypothetical protein